MKTILFLNPPGTEVFIRDYYCSKISKTGEVYFPLDLIYQTGYFKGYNILVLDCIAEKIKVNDCLSFIEKNKPEIIFSVSTSISIDEDILLFKKIKKNNKKIKLFLSADYALEEQIKFFKLSDNNIDGFLLDFTSDSLYKHLEFNEIEFEDLSLLIEYKNKKISSKIIKDFVLPVPRHDLFKTELYKYPFNKFGYCRGLLASFGCPYNCSFCIFSKLPYKIRKFENIIEEIEFIRSLGVKELHFDDQTFHTEYSYSKKIAQYLIDTDFKGGWVCFLRYDNIKFKTLKLFKKSGLHTAMVGVETASYKTSKILNKKINIRKLKNFFKMLDDLKIDSCATFILGLPYENKKDMFNTINLAIKLNLLYASFNTAVPKPNTDFKKNVLSDNMLSDVENIIKIDQNLSENLYSDNKDMDVQQIRKIAYKTFYFRLSYFIKKIKTINSVYRLLMNLKIAFRIFFKFT